MKNERFESSKSKCDVIVKYTFNGNDYYEIGKIQPENDPTACSYQNIKESAEYKQNDIKITVLHTGDF